MAFLLRELSRSADLPASSTTEAAPPRGLARETLLQAALDASSDAILLLTPAARAGADDDWVVEVVNQRFARLVDTPVAGLAGQLLRIALPRWPDFGLEADCRAVLGGSPGVQREVQLRLAGDLRWFWVTIEPLAQACALRLTDTTAAAETEQALRASVQRLQADNAQLRQLAWLDGLTGLQNRRALDVILEREVARARRNRKPLVLAMCDIDHFKAYNDFYGHLAGDDCLREVARVLAGNGARPADLVARYGGEEFVLVMPDTTLAGGLEVVRRAQQALRVRALPDATAPQDKLLTLSFGLAEFDLAEDTIGTTLLGRADAALYRAKHQGRNRIATASGAELAAP